MYINVDMDPTSGNRMEDGKWTAIFGMLQRREVDAAYMPVTMSSSRLNVVDFIAPPVEMRYCIVYR